MKTIKKLTKGSVALFALMLIVSTGSFMIQSCNSVNDSILDDEKELAISKFENLVVDMGPKLQNVVEKQNLRLKSLNNYDVKLQAEEEAKLALQPLAEESRELLTSVGFTEEELKEQFGESNSLEVTYLALSLLSYSKMENADLASFDISSIFVQSAYAGDIGPCIVEAFGVEALVDLWKGRSLSSFAARRALLKAVGKTAAKIGLGYFGAALAVADFAWCINR